MCIHEGASDIRFATIYVIVKVEKFQRKKDCFAHRRDIACFQYIYLA